MPNDRFLITGALGCIGAWTVRNLVREGTPVVVFDLASDPRRLKLIMSDDELARVTFVTGDITDLEALERALDDHAITRVIHLAALQIPFVRANPPLGARVNVVGTVNVFEAVARRRDRIGSLVYASSAAVYDAVDAGESGVVAHGAVRCVQTSQRGNGAGLLAGCAGGEYRTAPVHRVRSGTRSGVDIQPDESDGRGCAWQAVPHSVWRSRGIPVRR
jgi:nucleoside-diphosphate-sugar epimerase